MDELTQKVRSIIEDMDTYAAHVGITITHASVELGIATLPLTKDQRNGMGMAHGGAIFSLADMAFAAASHSSGTFWVNAQSSISYLAPGRIGPLRGEARCQRMGYTTCTYEVRILDSDDTLVALVVITGHNTKKPASLRKD